MEQEVFELTRLLTCLLYLVFAALMACSGDTDPCGPDGIQTVGGARFCVVRQGLVIEGGFACPADLPARISLPGGVVCAAAGTDAASLPPVICDQVGGCGSDGADGGPLATLDGGTDAGADGGSMCVDLACGGPGELACCTSELPTHAESQSFLFPLAVAN